MHQRPDCAARRRSRSARCSTRMVRSGRPLGLGNLRPLTENRGCASSRTPPPSGLVIPSTPAAPLFAFTHFNACFRFSLAQTSSISRSQADGLSGSGFAATGSAPRSAALGASPLPPLSRTRCVFCCAPMSSSPAYSPLLSVQAFRHNHRPTMPSADSCTAINNPCGLFSPDSRTPDRPPEGKHSRLHHTPARSTTQILDGHGLRNHVLARPAW